MSGGGPAYPDPDRPSLVVLAAGLGSRFGGTKQLAEVGAHGEAIVDYTIADARRAGFDQVVLIVRRELGALVETHLARIHGPTLPFRLVYQDELGAFRAKPWGTGHAVLATRGAVAGAFAVVNADDFYGPAAFETLAQALRRPAPDQHVLVAYRLDQTLSAAGPVSRGVCRVRGAELVSIEEHYGIERMSDGRITASGGTGEGGSGGAGSAAIQRVLGEDSPVSMNLWGLRPSIFNELGQAWEQFQVDVERGDRAPDTELQLPTVISAAVTAGRASVAVETTQAAWMGVTYPADLAHVQARIAAMVTAGSYPSPLC